MSEIDPGAETLARLPPMLGVEPERRPGGRGREWRLGGAVQRAWASPAAGADGFPAWRINLRTRALEGYSGAREQVRALGVLWTIPTLAGLVEDHEGPGRLELASSVEVPGSDIGWTLRVLAVAARAQAADAGRLCRSEALAAVGLAAVSGFPHGVAAPPVDHGFLTATAPAETGEEWTSSGVAGCMSVVGSGRGARVVRTPEGLCGVFLEEGGDGGSILEIKAGAEDPVLGRGVCVVLSTPFRGTTSEAIAWNGLEVGRSSGSGALGGWWAARGGLTHRTFYPDALSRKGRLVEMALAAVRRAREAARRAAERPPAPGEPGLPPRD
jgi:hypothetical protein